MAQPEQRPSVDASEFSTLTCRAAGLSSHDKEYGRPIPCLGTHCTPPCQLCQVHLLAQGEVGSEGPQNAEPLPL